MDRGAPRHTLDAMVEHAGIDVSGIPGRRHRAGYDAHVTALLLLRLAERFPDFAAMADAAIPTGLRSLTEPPPDALTLW